VTSAAGRRNRRTGRRAFFGSLAGHGAVAAAALFASLAPSAPAVPQTVRVRLVAAAPEDAPIREESAVPEVAEEEFRPPPPEPTPEPVPQVETPKIEEEEVIEVEPEPDAEPARTEEVGEEAVDVEIEGAPSSFPEYYQNIVRQVHRYWRQPGGTREEHAQVVFRIHRDGSVSDIEVTVRSGNPFFDTSVVAAVESAGRAGAFGPLPELFPGDIMRITFDFEPVGAERS